MGLFLTNERMAPPALSSSSLPPPLAGLTEYSTVAEFANKLPASEEMINGKQGIRRRA